MNRVSSCSAKIQPHGNFIPLVNYSSDGMKIRTSIWCPREYEKLFPRGPPTGLAVIDRRIRQRAACREASVTHPRDKLYSTLPSWRVIFYLSCRILGPMTRQEKDPENDISKHILCGEFHRCYSLF